MNNFEMPKLKLPEFKATKSGYEIRADILKQAQDLMAQEFSYKWQGYEMSGVRDEKTGQFVTTVNMPQFPGIAEVISTAERMYEFVKKSDEDSSGKRK